MPYHHCHNCHLQPLASPVGPSNPTTSCNCVMMGQFLHLLVKDKLVANGNFGEEMIVDIVADGAKTPSRQERADASYYSFLRKRRQAKKVLMRAHRSPGVARQTRSTNEYHGRRSRSKDDFDLDISDHTKRESRWEPTLSPKCRNSKSLQEMKFDTALASVNRRSSSTSIALPRTISSTTRNQSCSRSGAIKHVGEALEICSVAATL